MAVSEGFHSGGRGPPDAALHGTGDVRGGEGRIQPRLEARSGCERADPGHGGLVGHLSGTS